MKGEGARIAILGTRFSMLDRLKEMLLSQATNGSDFDKKLHKFFRYKT